tara:strand:+ start:678 stop:974 length:297 start_codon:yes stop_codon:yes gene_type:complete
MKNLLYLGIILILASCNAYKDIPVEELSIGMSTEQVQRIVIKELIQVSMSSDEDGVKQVFQAQKRIVRGGIARQQRYNFYFIDSKLVKYEKDSEKFSF